jgi:tRNA U34 2-thiouridine synthase MnmA/TrmU
MGRTVLRWSEPRRRVAPGQSVVLYRDDLVLGGGIVAE